MSDYNENNQGGYDPQSSSQSFGQGTGGAPIPPNSYYHYQGAGPGGVAGSECHGASQSRVSLCAAGGCAQRAGVRCEAGPKA